MLEFFAFLFLFITSLFSRWCVDNALIKGEIEEREYSSLPVMSELSTVRCDRAFGLWIAGTRASSVDGELPWSCRGGAVADGPCGGRW